MPAAVKIDRELVQALYLQGLNREDICKQTGLKQGTLRTWVARFKWDTLKEQARQALETAAQPSLAVQVAKDLSAKSKAAREALAGELDTQLQALKTTPANGFADLRNTPEGQGRAAVAKTIAETAAKVFGWDNETTKNSVNIHLIASLDPESASDGAPPIDV